MTAAINRCERPDAALRLAFAETNNRKAVIRYAANIIPSLKDEGFVAGFVIPYPRAREAIDVYADNADRVSSANAHARAFFLGTCLAVVLGYVLNRYVWMGVYGRPSIYRFALVILVPLFTVLVRVSFAWLVRRQAGRLDDESAFEIINGHVTRAADKHPENVPKVMRFLRRNLVSLFEGPQP